MAAKADVLPIGTTGALPHEAGVSAAINR